MVEGISEEIKGAVKMSAEFLNFGDVDIVRNVFPQDSARNDSYQFKTHRDSDFVWKRWDDSRSEDACRLIIEVGNELYAGGVVPFPRFIPSMSGEFIHISQDSQDRRRYSAIQDLGQGKRLELSEITDEHSKAMFSLHTQIVNALRGKSFPHESAAPSGTDVDSIIAGLEKWADFKFVPKEGLALPEEAERIQREIPELVSIAERLRPFSEQGTKSWIHGDFTQRHVLFNPDGTVGSVHHLDSVRKDFIGGDLAHTIDMLCIERRDEGFDDKKGANYYRTAPYKINYDRVAKLVGEIRGRGLVTDEEISMMPEHLALWALK